VYNPKQEGKHSTLEEGEMEMGSHAPLPHLPRIITCWALRNQAMNYIVIGELLRKLQQDLTAEMEISGHSERIFVLFCF
jgi:hypothetical protein